jgi:hypothetical protein
MSVCGFSKESKREVLEEHVEMSFTRPHLTNSEERISREIQKTIETGNLCSLHNGTEAFWVEVCDILTRDYFKGVVTSRLRQFTSFVKGDVIQFHARHIHSLA